MLLLKAIRFIIVALLAVVYWPLNISYLWLQKHYRMWKKDDPVSFIVATPLYYFFFLIVIIFSIPLELMGEKIHPPLGGFR